MVALKGGEFKEAKVGLIFSEESHITKKLPKKIIKIGLTIKVILKNV